MLITLKLVNGGVQTVDATSIELTLNGLPVELSVKGKPDRLSLVSAGTEEHWSQFAVFPGAANIVGIELRSHSRRADAAAC